MPQVKKRLTKLCGLRTRLILFGKELEDQRTLGSYGIANIEAGKAFLLFLSFYSFARDTLHLGLSLIACIHVVNMLSLWVSYIMGC